MKGAAWTIPEEIELLTCMHNGYTWQQMAVQLDRTPDAIVTRLVRLGQVIDQYNHRRYIRPSDNRWVVFATYQELRDERSTKPAAVADTALPGPDEAASGDFHAQREDR